jgi:hypothetical protein
VIVLPLSRWQGISDPNPQQPQELGAPAPFRPSGLPLAAGLVLSWPVRRGGRLLQERVVARRRS